jgi:phosphatidylserine decarboxylase
MTAPLRTPLTTRLFVALQYLLPQHGLTAAIHWLTRRREPWLRRVLIRGFMKLYRINLEDALIRDVDAFASFNEFFTRALKPGARPIESAATSIVSPCDGAVSECGNIVGEHLLQARLVAKAMRYTVGELLGDAEAALPFIGGRFATLYLAPFDYHRVHMPIAGTLRRLRYVPGALFSVNGATARAVPKLFARNERVVAEFTTSAGPMAIVFVGALNVGSISVVGFGDLTPRHPRMPWQIDAPKPAPFFLKGAELGRFNMGSTVILLLPPDSARFTADLTAGAIVRVGQAIGTLTAGMATR